MVYTFTLTCRLPICRFDDDDMVAYRQAISTDNDRHIDSTVTMVTSLRVEIIGR